MRFHRDVHTVHDPGGFWVNKISGNPVSRHRTKEVAVRQGRRFARKWKSEHAIHNLNGEIGRKNRWQRSPSTGSTRREKPLMYPHQWRPARNPGRARHSAGDKRPFSIQSRLFDHRSLFNDQTQIAELVAHVIVFGCILPRPAKDAFIREGAQQLKMTLFGIMQAGENSIDDGSAKPGPNDEIGFAGACDQAAVIFCRTALQCSYNSRSHRDDSSSSEARVLNGIHSGLWNFETLRERQTCVEALVSSRADSRRMRKPCEADPPAFQLEQDPPCEWMSR